MKCPKCGKEMIPKIGKTKLDTERKAVGLVNKKCFRGKASNISKKKLGADLEYRNKRIEVKGQKNKYPVAFRIYKTAIKENIQSKQYDYYVYIVFNIWTEPKLLVLNKKIIEEHREKSNQKGCWEILGLKKIIQNHNLKFKNL